MKEFKADYEDLKTVSSDRWSHEKQSINCLEYLATKFPETSSIFHKFDTEAIRQVTTSLIFLVRVAI